MVCSIEPVAPRIVNFACCKTVIKLRSVKPLLINRMAKRRAKIEMPRLAIDAIKNAAVSWNYITAVLMPETFEHTNRRRALK